MGERWGLGRLSGIVYCPGPGLDAGFLPCSLNTTTSQCTAGPMCSQDGKGTGTLIRKASGPANICKDQEQNAVPQWSFLCSFQAEIMRASPLCTVSEYTVCQDAIRTRHHTPCQPTNMYFASATPRPVAVIHWRATYFGRPDVAPCMTPAAQG